MPHTAGAKERGRERLLNSAASAFRTHGYGSIGVDGIAKAAGVTSGAFYAHFPSKAAAFRVIVSGGLEDLAAAVSTFRDDAAHWPTNFIDFYLGERRLCAPSEACALQSLTGDVARADVSARACYESGWTRVVDALAAGLGGEDARDRAAALLALLAGAVGIARAMNSTAASEALSGAARTAALTLARP